ncbi:MAG: amidoligase family protein [Clostridiales bacterium]|nr:amidoligase family protein [Clostridiales bacterium]
MLKEQLFGVEVEMTGITRATAAKVVADALGSQASRPSYGCYCTRTIKDQAGRTWKVMRDSSICPVRNDGSRESIDEYRVEFVTPPLNYSDIELLQSIIRKLREAGAKSHSSCGIHIHVDGKNHTAQSLRRLVNFMIARQDLIYEALEIGQREYSWCHKLDKDLSDAMKKKRANITCEDVECIWYSRANDGYCGGINHEHYNQTRYHGVNLHSFFTKGTVEFRLFNSTLHAGKIKAYIQFCLALSAWSITSNENISFRSACNYTAEQKVTLMRNILTRRLGLTGDEFKTCRLHIMAPLKEAAGMTSRAA